MEQLLNDTRRELELLQDAQDEEALNIVRELRDRLVARRQSQTQPAQPDVTTPGAWPMKPEEYERYSRQMVVPGIGLQGQLNLRAAKVLVIGAGGLGCPAASYLAGAGIGTLGIADADTVETSNLHRQIGHATARVGMRKTESLIAHLRGLNPLVTYRAHSEYIRPDNAAELIAQYDVVLDCTDRPAGRYLISDVCVLLAKPLVSAAALRTDGQLVVLNCPPVPAGSAHGAPCYRCVWRDPPRPELTMTCGEFGVLGPAVGIMGVMQANEAIKLIAAGRHIPVAAPEQPADPALLVFADWKSFASDRSAIRSVGMRRKPACIACGPARTITLEGIAAGTPNYEQFCGLSSAAQVTLPPAANISPAEYVALTEAGNTAAKSPLLLDVREPEHFSISSLPGAVNVRYRDVSRWLSTNGSATASAKRMPWEDEAYTGRDIMVICRTGQDSKDVVSKMLAKEMDKTTAIRIADITGGMKAWKEQVDNDMPFV